MFNKKLYSKNLAIVLTIIGLSIVTTGGVVYATNQDGYIISQQQHWGHDNISYTFDSYHDGIWRSSDPGSNFQIYKYENALRFRYDSDVAAGSGLTWNEGIILDKSGNVGIGIISPNSKLQVEGYLQIDTSSGIPPTTDCDDTNEIGRMKVDALYSYLYVCTNSGWVIK